MTRKPRTLGTRFRNGGQASEYLVLYQGLVSDASDNPVHMDLFHHARTSTLADLETALSPTDFWYRYALPLAHTVEAVKYAICALGAAHRAFKFQRLKEHPALHGLRNTSVQLYNQAIQCVQSVMGMATEQEMETILTCCVIFISVESLHGRYAESLRHLKAGTSLLISRINDGNQTNTHRTLEGTTSDDQELGTSRFLDDIAQALCRLGNDAWGYVRQMLAADLNFRTSTTDVPPFPDTTFASVNEAEEAFHNVTKLFEVDRTISLREIVASESRVDIPFMPAHVPDPYHLMPFEELRRIFDVWSQCFDLFRLQLDETTTSGQEILRTRALAVDQALWSGWLKCEVWADYRQEDYEEILRRAESLVSLDAFQSSPVFAFDGSLILSLAIPCVSSMDHDTQWRTVRLLRSFWRREGIWDSQELADILEAMMIATSRGMVTKDMLPWDVPRLARLMDSFKLQEVIIPEGPLLLA